jgi:isochorismate pyruvate lyase
MNSARVKPEECGSMADVRHGIDRLDEQIVALLAERFRYMDAAARIKQERGAVRDEARKAEVIGNAKRHGEQSGVPVAVVEEIYERLVEGSIAYELDKFDELRASAGGD